jgi:hypothetical protein
MNRHERRAAEARARLAVPRIDRDSPPAIAAVLLASLRHLNPTPAATYGAFVTLTVALGRQLGRPDIAKDIAEALALQSASPPPKLTP